jgi:hypothetical protein
MAVFLDYKTGGIAVVLNRRQHGPDRRQGRWPQVGQLGGFESGIRGFQNMIGEQSTTILVIDNIESAVVKKYVD